MAIPDYQALLIEVMELTDNNTIPQKFKVLVRLAELKFDQLRLGEMEKTAWLSIVDGKVQLPDDFLEIREMRNSTGRSMKLVVPEVSSEYLLHQGGIPNYYTMIGNRLNIPGNPTLELQVMYYARVPPLTLEDPSNWLLEKAPDLYLYAVAESVAAIMEHDFEKAQMFAALRQATMTRLKIEDERSRYGNAQAVVGGYTP